MVKIGLSWGTAIMILVVGTLGVSQTPKNRDKVSARIERDLKKLASVIDKKTGRKTIGFVGVISETGANSGGSATEVNSLVFRNAQCLFGFHLS